MLPAGGYSSIIIIIIIIYGWSGEGGEGGDGKVESDIPGGWERVEITRSLVCGEDNLRVMVGRFAEVCEGDGGKVC